MHPHRLYLAAGFFWALFYFGGVPAVEYTTVLYAIHICYVLDLPAIISGEWLCFMDPQMEIWKPAPGQKYKLTANKPRCRESFSPFEFSHHCSLKPCQDYDGTIIRFPLRKESSELSDKLYSVANLNTLLLSLKDDAAILLLFLRYVEKIEVFTINTSNTVSKIFSVEMDESTEYNRRKLKTKFLKDVTAYHSNPRSQLPHLQYETTVTVHNFQTRKQLDYQWLVIHWVGSRDKDVKEASSKVCSLPWIGFAVPLTLECPSRLFCFLPLPDSKEVNPPLPVCVHGTFGLNKDRRHLKWITSDMKNDAGALWNNLLLLKMLPSCYVDCLNVLKEKCKPEVFSSFWPSTSTIKKTNWKIGLNALLSPLLQGQYFWSENGRWVGLDSSVCVVPQVNSSQFPKVVIDVLIRCGKTVVVLPENVWEAVKFIYGNSYPFTTITSPVVRRTLKSNPQSYVNLSRAEKFQLLNFCLEDRKYADVVGLRLLPTLDGTFVGFEYNNSWQKMYVCKKKFAETKLLANYNSILVCLEGEEDTLHTKLNKIAENGYTQLQVLKPDIIAMLLKQTPPYESGWCLHGSAGGFYNDRWLKTFWKWVSKFNLSYFVGISLIPICNEKTASGFRVMPLLQKSNSKILKFSSISHTSLVSAAGKLDCYLTSANDFEFLYHSELKNYICELSPSYLLSISSQSDYQSEVFTQKEAVALREFLFQYPISVNVTQKSVLLNLQIFSTIQKGTFYSVKQAKSRVAGKSTTLLISEPEYLDKYLSFILPSPVILTCETSIVGNVQSMLQGACWVPTKLQLITHVILTAIESKQFSRSHVLKVTSILTEPGEYYSLADGQDGSLFVNKLKSLKFVPVGQRNDLYLPFEVFDPSDHMVRDLFDGQSVFPISPFSRNHYSILQQLGMKDCTSLSASDIIRVASLVINNDGGAQAEVKRACKLLEFLSSPTGNRLLNEYYNNHPLDQTLRSLQWLPVITTPPKGYPKCLGWKGSSSSQFVSAQSLHASSSPEEHKKLPNLIGSQMKILQYEETLPVKLIASLNISQSVPVDVMIQHFLKLIKHKTEIERQKVNVAVKLLYTYLQQAADNNHTSQYWQLLKQSEVVQVSDNKFVLPSVVACSFDEKCMTVGKLEPYWYILPPHFQQYRSLFCFIGATDTINVSDILSVFKRMLSTSTEKTRDLPLVKKILQWLCNKFTGDELIKMHECIFVPVNHDDENRLVLKPADKVAYLNEDLHWLKDVKGALGTIAQDYFLVHSSISYDMCCALKLKPLNTMIANSEEYGFEQAGQSEPLTTRLNRILREYKDTSVIQELLQNADDAGATEVAIYYDTRKHDSSHLFFPGMANSYGPALLFYNNAEFSEEDFENIRKIAGETKMNKPLKIGKFGVGFCSVYHLTDVPSFVSGESLVIFDPTLQCLRKQIKSEFNPGIKINFNQHVFLKESKQLNPYMGIGGFNPKKPFQGTLFRFPLRLSSSDISKNVYTKAKVQFMVNRIKENSSKLLMFLSSVKKVSFYQSHGDGFDKHFEITVGKESIYNSISCQVSVTTIVPSSKCKDEKWLIATEVQRLVVGQKEQKHGTASLSVKLSKDDTSNKLCVGTIKGECFCFLPLNIETGLPVHVSSNFAVTTNRRGIWKADDAGTATKESNWNKLLMESVVAQAYIKLLLSLQQMQQDGSLVNYTFHSLWPINLNEINPWDFLVNKVYMDIFSSQHSLFYSKVMGCWKKLNECNFLSKLILQISGFSNDLYESIYRVAATLKLPVVHLPDKLLDKHKDNSIFNSQIIDEEEFIKHFYQDKTLSMVSVQDKTKIVAASLLVFANNRHTKAMPVLMKNTKCIPCSPDGKIFKKPQELLDPNSKIAQLFSLDNGVFPDQNFLSRHYLLTISLRNLGVMTSLSWELVIDRARCVEEWYNENAEKALKRLVVLVECIKDNSSECLPQKSVTHELQQIPFLPTMKKPEIYPIKWKADSMSHLLCGPELLKALYGENNINAVYACGSHVPILDTHYLSPHLTPNVRKILGISQEIDVIHVVGQFIELLQWFQGISSDSLSKEFLECTNDIALTVYYFLSTKLKSMNDDLLQKHLLPLKDQPCIWNGKWFLTPACICFNWEMPGPYLYKFPEVLEPFVDLMEYLGIENDFSAKVMLNALHEMKSEYGHNRLPKNIQAVVRLILPKLTDHEIQSDTDIFLPDNKFVLRSFKELKYNDAPWCVPSEEYVYCHECVVRTVAIHLGVELVKNIMLGDLDITSSDLLRFGKEFGQQEKLTQRLNNILRDYPSDITFLKELLQNADDAGATQLFIILDKRLHDNEKVISDEWKPLQGPALLFWNNSSFSDEDLIGIQKIGLGSKRDDADKIGQYGIGFNVVYHFTDCPSFVTNDRLCIMDPHYRYIAPKRMKPGWMFQDLETLWNRFPDMKSPYLLNDLDDLPAEMKEGSLFRLPLRLTVEEAEQSEIVESNGYFKLDKLESDLKRWVPEMREALLFVHNVCDIRLYVIEPSDTGSVGVISWDDPQPIVLCSHVESARSKKNVILDSGNCKLTTYNMKLANKQTNKEVKWVVQLGEGNPLDDTFEWKGVKPPDIELCPRHGIAAPLFEKRRHFSGKSFCFLPLLGYTDLPVHIHGQFVLHSDRRGLWASSDDGGHGKHKITDPKKIWNDLLIEAIGASYAHFLTHCIAQGGSVCDEEKAKKSLENYYKLFPVLKEASNEPWNTLAKEVYKALDTLNPPILATLVKQNEDGQDCLYSINWCQLHLPGAPDEGYFYKFVAYQQKKQRTLNTIGMNLVSTPLFIYEQFQEVEVSLPFISQQSVLNYYTKFHDEIFMHQSLPCHISTTKFGEVECFITFVEYLSVHKSTEQAGEVADKGPPVEGTVMAVTEESADVNSYQTLGFLLTANEYVHCLSDGLNTISSSNWELFLKSQNNFLHKDLMAEFKSSNSIFQPSDDDGFDLIHSVFAANLPSSWCGPTQASIKDVEISLVYKFLKCIAEDPVFKVYCQQLLSQFTLIPADNDMVYSTISELLPMTTGPYTDKEEKELLRKLQIPFVDTLVPHILGGSGITLPSMSNHSDVLKNVYLSSKNCPEMFANLNEKEMEILFEIFKRVSYSSSKHEENPSVKHIKSLPIFKTITGDLIQLSSVSTVWIWNNQVCKDGLAEWMNQIDESEVFLDPTAPWKVLRSHTEYLDIKEISLYELYCNYIFPNFCTMNFEVRIEHIKFISKRVFHNCVLHLEYAHLGCQSKAKMFVDDFKSLECIGTDDSNLCTIDSFYDHSQEMFTTFCDGESFLPKVLHDEDIQQCLRFFGLKTVPSTADFIQFCYELKEFQDIATVHKASQILLQCLFDSGKKYEHLHTQAFLQQISSIPIAVVAAVPMLNAIKAQQLGECTVVGREETITLTKLSGSSLEKHKHCVWTSRPLVKLPIISHGSSYCARDKERMNSLGVSFSPETNDIVQNLKNIADTEFSDFSRFHKRMSPSIAKTSTYLPTIVVKIIECLRENLKKRKQPDSDKYEQLRLDIGNLKFLPVKLQAATGYVLVKPIQVLVMDTSKLAPYSPFLHPLIVEAQPVLQLLTEIGVKMSLDYSHIQFVLTLAKELSKNVNVDHNIKRAVVHATVELTVLLRSKQARENISLHSPLYLLNNQDVLTDCSKLVVFDISSARRPVLPSEFTYLNSLQNISAAMYWNPKELLELLPKDLGLKSLKSILQYTMTADATAVQIAHSHVTTIEQILRSNVFKTAIESYACYCANKRVPPEVVTKTMTDFQSKLTVQYVKEVQLRPHLHLDNEITPLGETVFEDFFLQSCNDKYILILKNAATYASQTYLKMSGSLCIALELQGTYFEVSQVSGIPQITSYISMILSCGSVFKITDLIRGSLPGIDNIEQDMVDTEPVLGEVIPECWHHRLDQNIFNYFMPQELVGYETETNDIIYAQVLYCNNTDNEEDMEQIFELKYTISIGNDTELEVTVLQLYKFVSVVKEPLAQDSSSGELELHETGNSENAKQARQARVAGGKQAIRAAVKAAWNLPEEQKRKAVKRLYLQYHPDKNPDNPNATAEFQFLLQELERMEKGYPEEPLDAEQPFRPPTSFNFGWSGWFNQWDQTAFSHRSYRSRDRARGTRGGAFWRGGGGGGWQTPKPQTNHSEAVRWIKQAEYDYASLSTLMTSSQTDEKTCASTCFMCHEVAEKSLKAGMYAKCGMAGDTTLKNHNVVTPARALIQMGCDIDVDDAIFLEHFYSHPRFPYCYPPPTVPGEKYVSSTARAAFDAATRIYEVIKQLIDDEE